MSARDPLTAVRMAIAMLVAERPDLLTDVTAARQELVTIEDRAARYANALRRIEANAELNGDEFTRMLASAAFTAAQEDTP